MLPADFPLASFNLISVNDVQLTPLSKKKEAASSVISQSSRKRIGQVITALSSCKTLQTPSGFLALSFVQFGTLLLKGHKRCERYRFALAD
jgi:hypothetical protein